MPRCIVPVICAAFALAFPAGLRADESAAPAAPAETAQAAAACPYPVDHDAPLNPEEKVVEKAKTYTKYRVEFNGIKKDRVPAFLYVPTDRETRHRAVLLQYGTGGNKNTFYIFALAQQFFGHGFVVLTIHSPHKSERRPPPHHRPRGASFGQRGRVPWEFGGYN